MSQSQAARNLVEPLSAEQIDRLPVYEWQVARVGDAAPPFRYVVTEQSIADYCAAVRNMNPLYMDAAHASRGPFGGIVAPPTYAFKCAPLRRNEVMHARGYASPEEKAVRATPYAKSEIFFGRPLRPGDEITSVVTLEETYERRGSQFMTWRTRATDQHGAQVVDYTYTIIWRQAPPTLAHAEAAPSRQAPDPPAQAEPAAAQAPDQQHDGEVLPTLRKLESQAAIDRYAELTRVRPRAGQSLHSDADFAQRTIFGGTVNMGVATAAYCSEVLEMAYGPQALLRDGARLEFKAIGPIRAGDEITIGGHALRRDTQTTCELSVINQAHRLVGVASATLITS